MKKIQVIAAYVCAIIFLQTLFFKFTGAAESVWIFKRLGVEPWGRYISGIMELVAAIALLKASTRLYGALLASVIMGGALVSHLSVLGVEVQNDGGLLFILALVSLFSACLIIFTHCVKSGFKILSSSLILLMPLNSHALVSYNTESDYGIHGYDPVSYILLKKAQEGKKDLKTTYDGITYLFSNKDHKEAFIKEPQKYIPAYGGWCAYAMAKGEKVDIDPNSFKIIDGKAYLFYNGLWGDTLKKWEKDEVKLRINADNSWKELIK